MAHALYGYEGQCRNIHGHSYKLYVTVIGERLDEDKHPENGMVMDFGSLKKIVKTQIIEQLDHALLLTRNTPQENMEKSLAKHEVGLKVVYTDYPTTCEAMLADFAGRIKKQLPSGVRLHSLKLAETSTSYAEWYAGDN